GFAPKLDRVLCSETIIKLEPNFGKRVHECSNPPTLMSNYGMSNTYTIFPLWSSLQPSPITRNVRSEFALKPTRIYRFCCWNSDQVKLRLLNLKMIISNVQDIDIRIWSV